MNYNTLENWDPIGFHALSCFSFDKEYRMTRFGPTEMLIILVIVILLFGVGRIGKIAGELGRSIREFRKGLSSDDVIDVDKEKVEPKE